MYIYLIILLIITILYILILRNSIIKLNNKVDEAFSTMDVYLKKRWDLIPNLVELVKNYANHEKQTLEDVIKIRNTKYNNMSQTEKLNTNIIVEEQLSKLLLLKEDYPELKSNKNFLDLNQKLTKCEDDIANSRKYYNAIVRIYNNKVQMFPNNIVAKIFRFKDKKMFEISNNERNNIKIDL